mmetsp:Transcript_11272/g.30753  ORF Transcript_11272/g.30753 Transcript_11272/m.30753 type:complete len:216 (-) Transcript_11272:510-1157(-)
MSWTACRAAALLPASCRATPARARPRSTPAGPRAILQGQLPSLRARPHRRGLRCRGWLGRRSERPGSRGRSSRCRVLPPHMWVSRPCRASRCSQRTPGWWYLAGTTPSASQASSCVWAVGAPSRCSPSRRRPSWSAPTQRQRSLDSRRCTRRCSARAWSSLHLVPACSSPRASSPSRRSRSSVATIRIPMTCRSRIQSTGRSTQRWIRTLLAPSA